MTSPDSRSRAEPSERVLGRYRIRHRIAAGGMGAVHLASAQGAGGFERLVAVKLLHAHLAGEDEFVAMFLDEARLAARIRHPNVVATIDVLDAPELAIVMELIEGVHLGVLTKRAIARGTRLPAAVGARIVLDALAGLAAAHELRDEQGRSLGLVHRDVSPQNVLVGIDGVTRLTDFGVARAEARLAQTREGALKGKLGYMPPEQMDGGPPDARGDLFAMGVVLWEALACSRLFAGDSDAEIVGRVSVAPIPSLSSIAPELGPFDPVVARALARDPERRFQTAREMARALEDAAPVIAPARVVGETVVALADDALAQLRPRARPALELVEPGAMRSEEITRPVTTAARRRTESAQPAAARAPTRRAGRVIAGAALLAGVVAAAVLVVRSGGGDPPAQVAPDREATLIEGDPPEVPAGTRFVPTIELRLRVGEDGRVREALVERPTPERRALEDLAVAAAGRWRFEPAVRGGRAVESWITWPVEPTRAAEPALIRIRGSDTLGAALLPELARAHHDAHPEVTVDVEALGSSTGFVALFDGSADVAASSRLIRTDEIEEAERLGIVVRELLLGWDGIAVIAHPSSRLESLTLDALGAIYEGRDRRWSVVTRPRESGTFGFFAERVLDGGTPTPDAITIEHSAEVVRYVASDPRAIGYVGMGLVTPGVRVIPIQRGDVEAIAPTRETVSSGRYPLARPLLLYVRDPPSAATLSFLREVFSDEGRAVVTEHGFTAVDRAPATLERLEAGASTAPRTVRLLFEPESSEPSAAMRTELEPLVTRLEPGEHLAVRGHASATERDPDALATRRAESVAAALAHAGIDRAHIDARGLGTTQPIGPLGSELRARLDRRVDVQVVPAER